MKNLFFRALLIFLALAGTAAAQPGPSSGPFVQNNQQINPKDPTSCLVFPSTAAGGCKGNGTANFSDVYVGGSPIQGSGLPYTQLWIGNLSGIATPQQMSGDCTLAADGVITCAGVSGIVAGATSITSGHNNGLAYQDASGKFNVTTSLANAMAVTDGSSVLSLSTTLPAVDASAATVTSTGSITAISEAARWAKSRSVQDYGAPHDFVTSDSTAIQAALNAASSAGGGTVYLEGFPYWSSDDITVPRNVVLTCVGNSSKLSIVAGVSNFQNIPCGIYFSPGKGLIQAGSSIVSNISIFPLFVHTTTIGANPTRAASQAFLNSFAGTGVKYGAVSGGPNPNANANLDNVMIGGFATCISINGTAQINLVDVLGDCTTGQFIDNSGDDNRMRNLEFWPFLLTNNAPTNFTWNITAAADNGSGAWRLTLSAPEDIQTGETLWVDAANGAEGTRGFWTVTAVDSTHVDLQGSAVAPTATGATTSGSTYVTLDSVANLQPSMTVSGTNIPAGATVAAVWRSRNAISLDQSHAATGTGSGITLTFGSNAYTSGATLTFDRNWRTGIGFDFHKADGSVCEACFAYGYQTGFSFNGSTGMTLTNVQVDGPTHSPNQNAVPINIYFTGSQTYANFLSGSLLTSGSVHIMEDATNSVGSYANVVEGFRLAALGFTYDNAIEVSKGQIIVKGTHDGTSHNILIDSSAETPVFVGNALSNTSLFGTTANGEAYKPLNRFGGSLDQQGGYAVVNQLDVARIGGGIANFYNPNAGVDNKYWRFINNSSSFFVQLLDDAYTVGTPAMAFTRSGTTLGSTWFYSSIRPSANDGAALGTSTVSWSDLFLASGGVINWNNGAYTLTQSGSTLTTSGSFSATAFSAGATAGVTCSGAPTASFATVNGIVTHC